MRILKQLKNRFFSKSSSAFTQNENVISIFDENPPSGTHYQDEFDRERLKSLKPYIAKESGSSLDEIKRNININFFLAYGPDFTSKVPASISVDGPVNYEHFLRNLSLLDDIVVDTFAATPPKEKLHAGQRKCVIRHDVDGDLVAALQQAKIEKKFGFRTSYYLLHTAPYYGLMGADGTFSRNENSAEIYKSIQDQGHEIALHTDAMLLYQDHRVDGADALRQEINWLRKQGCNLVGTTAHNSWPSYGCENYSIFEGKVKGNIPDKKGVFHNGKWAPMQILKESDLGIEYEANELLWQTHTPVLYCALRSLNEWRVDLQGFCDETLNIEFDMGRLREYRNKFVSTTEVLELIKTVPTPVYIYIVVHPMHYGMRASTESEPWYPVDNALLVEQEITSASLVNSRSEIIDTSVTRKNELGMPDRGLHCYAAADKKVLFFGNENFSTPLIPADAKCTQVLSRRLGRELRSSVGVLGFGSEHLSVGQVERVLEISQPVGEPQLMIFLLDSNNMNLDSLSKFILDELDTGKNIFCLIDSTQQHDSAPHYNTLLKRVTTKSVVLDKWLKSTRLSDPVIMDSENLWTKFGHYILGARLAENLKEYFA